MRAIWNGEVISESDDTVIVEGNHYFPESSLRLEFFSASSDSETWRGMEGAHSSGLCRHLGVSNFSASKMRSLLEIAAVKPKVNQIELHPHLQQPDLVDFCQSQGVHVTAYASLGSLDRPDNLKGEAEPVLLDDPTVAVIAKQLGVTPARVLLAWAIGREITVIPKSVSPNRLEENLASTRRSPRKTCKRSKLWIGAVVMLRATSSRGATARIPWTTSGTSRSGAPHAGRLD